MHDYLMPNTIFSGNFWYFHTISTVQYINHICNSVEWLTTFSYNKQNSEIICNFIRQCMTISSYLQYPMPISKTFRWLIRFLLDVLQFCPFRWQIFHPKLPRTFNPLFALSILASPVGSLNRINHHE